MNTEKQPRFSLECVAATFFDIVMLSQKQPCIVSLENKSAKVIIDPIVADETLRYAIEEAGYVLNEIL